MERKSTSLRCTQCGRELTDEDVLYWQCAGCRKSIRATLPAMRALRKKRDAAPGRAILKCRSCGAWLDDGKERIFFKCASCGKVISGTLDYFSPQGQEEPGTGRIENQKGNPGLLGMMKKKSAGTKFCRYCKMEIPRGAKVCPHCRKEQGGKKKWVVAAVLAFMFIGAVTRESKDKDDVSAVNPSKSASADDGDAQERESAKSDEENRNELQADASQGDIVIEYEDVFFYDLVGNIDDYSGKYVRTVVQVRDCYQYGDEPYISSEFTDSDLTGNYADITIYPKVYQEFDSETYIAVEGMVPEDGSMKIIDAEITDYGSAPEERFNEELAAYKEARNQQLQQEKDEFIASCVAVSYDDLRRYPDTYKDVPVKLFIKITDVEPDGWIFQGDIMASFDGEELAVYDDRLVREPRFAEGDAMTVYATGNGLAKVKVKADRILFDKTVDEYEVPAIMIKYTENDKDFVE